MDVLTGIYAIAITICLLAIALRALPKKQGVDLETINKKLDVIEKTLLEIKYR
jgi:hypothetical protein